MVPATKKPFRVSSARLERDTDTFTTPTRHVSEVTNNGRRITCERTEKLLHLDSRLGVDPSGHFATVLLVVVILRVVAVTGKLIAALLILVPLLLVAVWKGGEGGGGKKKELLLLHRLTKEWTKNESHL